MIKGLDERLLLARNNTNLSRKQVAELIGVSESLIGLYESGTRQPSLNNLLKLAQLYKVSTDFLLGCESTTVTSLSTAGLNSMEIKAVQQIVECFHLKKIKREVTE